MQISNEVFSSISVRGGTNPIVFVHSSFSCRVSWIHSRFAAGQNRKQHRDMIWCGRMNDERLFSSSVSLISGFGPFFQWLLDLWLGYALKRLGRPFCQIYVERVQKCAWLCMALYTDLFLIVGPFFSIWLCVWFLPHGWQCCNWDRCVKPCCLVGVGTCDVYSSGGLHLSDPECNQPAHLASVIDMIV